MSKNGAYLKRLRKESGLSLKDVYTRCGITDSRLSRIERDEGTPLTATELRTLANLYSIDLVKLYLDIGYLDENDLDAYSLVFRNASLLTAEEKLHIQEQIDLFTRGRTVTSDGIQIR